MAGTHVSHIKESGLNPNGDVKPRKRFPVGENMRILSK